MIETLTAPDFFDGGAGEEVFFPPEAPAEINTDATILDMPGTLSSMYSS